MSIRWSGWAASQSDARFKNLCKPTWILRWRFLSNPCPRGAPPIFLHGILILWRETASTSYRILWVKDDGSAKVMQSCRPIINTNFSTEWALRIHYPQSYDLTKGSPTIVVRKAQENVMIPAEESLTKISRKLLKNFDEFPQMCQPSFNINMSYFNFRVSIFLQISENKMASNVVQSLVRRKDSIPRSRTLQKTDSQPYARDTTSCCIDNLWWTKWWHSCHYEDLSALMWVTQYWFVVSQIPQTSTTVPL